MEKEAAKKSPAEPLRCQCGNLLARLVPDGVELKCRRWKRRGIPLFAATDRPTVSKPTS